MNAQTVTIASIVEGHGDKYALPRLLHRLAADLGSGVLRTPEPWRLNRGGLVASGGIERAVVSVASRIGVAGGVLAVLDADDDCPAKLAPSLLARARSARPDVKVSVVLAMREFEAWFLAAAPSLAGRHGLAGNLEAPVDPEGIRDAKGWLTRHRQDGHPYKPTIDQANLASTFDMKQARGKSPSFNKFAEKSNFY
jgi:hypothetical protein